MLQPNTIKPARGSKRKRKILGRGNASGHGNYSTRGGKGQTARSGGSRGLNLKGFKYLMASAKKLRGFHSLKVKPAEVYLSDLDKKYNEGEIVNLSSLKEKNIINNNAKAAKVVFKGDLVKKLTLEGITCTPKAAEKIKSVGGEIK